MIDKINKRLEELSEEATKLFAQREELVEQLTRIEQRMNQIVNLNESTNENGNGLPCERSRCTHKHPVSFLNFSKEIN